MKKIQKHKTSTHPPIHSFTHPPIHPSTHSPIHSSTRPLINPSTHQPINPSTHTPILPTSSSLLPTSSIPCFILAGGKSSRFGEDKAKHFYTLQYKICKSVFKEVYFAAKYKKFKNYPFFIEKSKTYAPIFALEEIIKKHKKVFVINIDTPLITPKTIRKLLSKKAVAAQNPLIGYYDYTMLKKISKSKKTNLKIYGINKNSIKIPKKEAVNINKKEDLKLNLSNIIRQRRKWNIK